MEAHPADAKGEALHRSRGFVGDFHTADESFRLMAYPNEKLVVAVPASDVSKEFEVDATLSTKQYREAFWSRVEAI
jgi:hypothetical protein